MRVLDNQAVNEVSGGTDGSQYQLSGMSAWAISVNAAYNSANWQTIGADGSVDNSAFINTLFNDAEDAKYKQLQSLYGSETDGTLQTLYP
ncbi:hypothetical protein ACO0LM_18965 [Undibacterium sp. Di26W]|uniref:hypothetical protein n=1 Tax=Undibacterium sp. Di26W TaxID=3413035 RepID=UPI003BF24F7F